MKVSIIIPVYNCEPYLQECLDSIINQTYKNTEIILINDGSTDNSEKIIKRYLKKYSNIKYKSQTNSGQSVARNKGLELATGDYIMFVDADDFIELNMIEKLLKPFDKNDIDISFCEYSIYYEKNNIEKFQTINGLSKDPKREYIFSPPSPCVKLFKAEFLKDFKFPEGIIYEDLAAIPFLIAKANVYYVNEYLYYYRKNYSSTVGKAKFSKKRLDILKASEILYNNFKSSEYYIDYKEELDYLLINHLFFYAGLRFCRYPHPKEKIELIIDFKNKYMRNYENNIYYQQNSSKEQKKIIKNILNNKIIYCYCYFINKKIKEYSKKKYKKIKRS